MAWKGKLTKPVHFSVEAICVPFANLGSLLSLFRALIERFIDLIAGKTSIGGEGQFWIEILKKSIRNHWTISLTKNHGNAQYTDKGLKSLDMPHPERR